MDLLFNILAMFKIQLIQDLSLSSLDVWVFLLSEIC